MNPRRTRKAAPVIAFLAFCLRPLLAWAQEPSYDTGDTAWMLTSTALVLMMTIPGLALFYGGLVRPKNVLSTLMHSFFCAALVSVTWVLYGYSLAFGPTLDGFVGRLDHAYFRGMVGNPSELAPTIPHVLFAAFQGTFAIITPALISGAFAERMRFPAFVLYMLLWSTCIYSPLAHWVWGGGWIGTELGALDFAGGTVVHISSGVSALVTALYLGRRLGYAPGEALPPHNLPLTVVGASLLWVGWFGFNAGSALGSGELASVAFVNTNTAAAAAALAWLLAEWLRAGKPTILGAASGAVAGLVCITPAAGFVTPAASIVFGLAAGIVCYMAVMAKTRLGYDDALDVVGVHMVGGTLGALLTGVFATSSVNPAISDLTGGLPGGLFSGYPELVVKQLLAVLATYAFCGFGTLVILVVVNAVTALRPAAEDELLGLDLSQHSEQAYPHFQIAHGLGPGERRSLERELEEAERRRQRILELMHSAETGAGRSSLRSTEERKHAEVQREVAAAGSRVPPTTTSRVPPPPRPAAAPPRGAGGSRLVVENVDKKWLKAVWEDLCQQYPLNVPPDFKEIYEQVVSFRDNVFTFRGGDAQRYRDKVANLLYLYGVENPSIRVE
ncbi:MAG: hypothetical protein KatS3mg076_3230 [Candidatus Binatia bacterium]|nr:MAG: hypothetical protein KatS3mg076_3230 [Candidatus Binatia bacterium]